MTGPEPEDTGTLTGSVKPRSLPDDQLRVEALGLAIGQYPDAGPAEVVTAAARYEEYLRDGVVPSPDPS